MIAVQQFTRFFSFSVCTFGSQKQTTGEVERGVLLSPRAAVTVCLSLLLHHCFPPSAGQSKLFEAAQLTVEKKVDCLDQFTHLAKVRCKLRNDGKLVT